MIHSFLLIGQSNMAGRGRYDEVEPIVNNNIFVLRNGIFRPMHFPINFDRTFSGLCLAESFADEYQKEMGVSVGLIPAADGGTSLDQWKEGEILFDNACYQAELASRTSELKGILWHQGEADCSPVLYLTYAERLTKMINAMRKRLGMPNIPFLLGGLGDFLKYYEITDNLKNYPKVNEALLEVSKSLDNVGFVSAVGLTSNPDNLHFNSKSLREFGIRYFNGYKKLDAVSSSSDKKMIVGGKSSTKMELL